MVQWTTYFFVKGMTLWNNLTACFYTISHNVVDFTSYMMNYFHKNHNIWYLCPNHTLPLSHNHIKNRIHSQWIYNSHLHILSQKQLESTSYKKIKWLSATLIIRSHQDNQIDEFPIDDFIHDLNICCNDDTLPTLKELFLIWCIRTKHWFDTKDEIIFQIIDHEGELQNYNINDTNLFFIEDKNKLIIRKLIENTRL